MVEVVPGARREQLQHAVHAVGEEPGCEPSDRAQVEPLPAPREVGHRAREEHEVQRELDHSLHVLVERLLRLQIEEAE